MCREARTRGLGGKPSLAGTEPMTWLIAEVTGGLLCVVAALLGWLFFPAAWGQPELGVSPRPRWEGAAYLGVGAGVGEEPERALLVAERAHDGVVGLADLLAAGRGAEGSQGEQGLPGAPRSWGWWMGRVGCPPPYLTWLELNTVIPATNTTSPATAAMPSR